MQPILLRESDLSLRPGKRLFDLFGAALLLVVLAPLAALIVVALLLGGGTILRRRPRLGLGGEAFDELRFARGRGWMGARLRATKLDRLPRLWNVLVGHMSFVGPRALAPDEADRPSSSALRWTCRPGLTGLWQLRRRANMAFDTEETVNEEYATSAGLVGDLGILCRALPYLFVDAEAEHHIPDEVEILGLRVDNPDMDGAVQAIAAAAKAGEARRVLFVNAHCVNVAYRDRVYRSVLHGADLLLADGIGMRIAGKVLGGPVRQNVNGTDLFPRLLARCEEEGLSVFFLGAKPGVAEKVARWAGEHHPRLDVRGWHHGYLDETNLDAVKARIRSVAPDLLFVAMGVPAQERWLDEHLVDTGARVGIAVGGLFDFFSGSIPRAPLWMRELGLEWAYRLWQEPGRMWKRYVVGNVVFLWHVFAARVFGGPRL